MWSASYHVTEETSRFILSTGSNDHDRSQESDGVAQKLRHQPADAGASRIAARLQLPR
jgi:hypothetical protein